VLRLNKTFTHCKVILHYVVQECPCNSHDSKEEHHAVLGTCLYYVNI